MTSRDAATPRPTFMQDVHSVLKNLAGRRPTGDGIQYAAVELLARWDAEAPRSETGQAVREKVLTEALRIALGALCKIALTVTSGHRLREYAQDALSAVNEIDPAAIKSTAPQEVPAVESASRQAIASEANPAVRPDGRPTGAESVEPDPVRDSAHQPAESVQPDARCVVGASQETMRPALVQIIGRVDELESESHQPVPFSEVRALQEIAQRALGTPDERDGKP